MADERSCFVIVGAGLAGGRAAETLRAEGFGGRVVLLGAEERPPYNRPPLSKGVLAGNEEAESAYLHEREWYDEQGVELRLGVAATSLDVKQHQVGLADGETLGYDRLLLATGAGVRRLRIPGNDRDGVHYLRTMTDSLHLRDRLVERPRTVVVGAGWIGMEVAAAARSQGAEVTVLEPQETPLHAVLGPKVGRLFGDLHRRHGVDLRLGSGVAEIRGADATVSAVVTSDAEEIPVDLVVVGVGVIPRTELAESAGLEVDDGIVCDQGLRTSDPDVFAVGDAARWYNPLLGRQIRVEHWANALAGGPAAARSMLGQEVAYDVVPFFFTDQYDVGMEYAGYVPAGGYDDVVLRGDPASGAYMAFWLAGSTLLAGMHVNTWDTIDAVQDVIRSSRPVDPEKLADPQVELDQVYAS